MDVSFDKLFTGVTEDFKPIVNSINVSLFARHNRGYERNAGNLMAAFGAEKRRYQETFNFVKQVSTTKGSLRLLDVGTLIGILPVLLAQLGMEVHVSEAFSLYSAELKGLKDYLREHNVAVHDVDLMKGLAPFSDESFDLVTLLAVIEHLPSTPRYLLAEIKRVLKPGGILVLDTPNVAASVKRLLFLLKGQPPYPDLADFFYSEPPFTGHHREYTIGDVRWMLEEAGFNICQVKLFNLSPYRGRRLSVRLVGDIVPLVAPTLRNYIWVAAIKND